MEAANAHHLDRCADQLFLASRAGCELGTRPLLSRATLNTRVGVLIGLLTRRAIVHLSSDEFVSELAHYKMEEAGASLRL